MKYSTYLVILLHICIHCKFLNARFECNDIVIFIYVHYPLDQNAKAFDTKGKTCNIKCLFRSLVIQTERPTFFKAIEVIIFHMFHHGFKSILKSTLIFIFGIRSTSYFLSFFFRNIFTIETIISPSALISINPIPTR